jgi:hypothetical protein
LEEVAEPESFFAGILHQFLGLLPIPRETLSATTQKLQQGNECGRECDLEIRAFGKC